MRHIIFFLFFAGLMACNQPAAPTDPTPAPPEAVSESGEPLAATDASVAIVTQTVYCSYHLVRGAGAIQTTGGQFIQTKAWTNPTAGQPIDNTVFLRELITALEREGVLAGVDLTKTKANWLIVLFPGASPRRDWVLDSRDLPQPPKE